MIQGIHAFYKNKKGEEFPGVEGRDKSIKEVETKTLEIPDNDFLCYLNIYVGDDFITKLIFKTKKGKELIVGNEDGKEKFPLNEKD